jgi:hypothetical protein
MKRISYGANGTVADNLVDATRILLGRAGLPPLDLLARLPENRSDWIVALRAMLTGIGVPPGSCSIHREFGPSTAVLPQVAGSGAAWRLRCRFEDRSVSF